MLKYFIGVIICGGLLFWAIQLVKKIEARINETSGKRTDTLYISFLIFLVIDCIPLLYFFYKLVLIF